MIRYDFVVVGGGLLGACIAEELARGDARVLVLDAGVSPGRATRQAAGVAAPPLRYAADAEFFGWLIAAQEALRDDIARFDSARGAFALSRTLLRLLRPQDLQAFDDLAARGLPVGKLVSGAETAERWPGLCVAGGQQVAAAEALMVDGASYLTAARAAALAASAEWRQNAEVIRMDQEPTTVTVRCADGRTATADRVVLTSGAWTGTLTEGRIPVGPQRGQLAVLTPGPGQELDYILSSRYYLAPLRNGDIVVGATEEDAGFTESCTAEGLARLFTFAIRAVPALGGVPVRETRAGLRPVSATGRPQVGRVPGWSRVYVAAGHAGFGLLTARHTARGSAAGLLHRNWDQLPDSFCPVGGD